MAAEPNAGVDIALRGATICSQEPVAHSALPALGSMINLPERNGEPPLTLKPAPQEHDEALVAGSLARRALCPDCVRLGGCPHGIPGLIPLPERGEIESITKKSKSYLEKLMANGVVAGHRLRSTMDAARGETYLSGPSLCAALKRGEIMVGETEGK
jgi:hypothetical protein